MQNLFSAREMIRCVYISLSCRLSLLTNILQTDEDMFRALLLFPEGREPTHTATMDPPLAVTLVDADNVAPLGPVTLAIKPEAVFTTAVGPSSKPTLARWHVNTPEEVVGHMLWLVEGGVHSLL